MRRTILIAIAIVFAVLPVAAGACSYPEPPTFRSALSTATDVFIFRLDRAEYKRQELGSGAFTAWVDGEINPIQNLYGDSTKYRKIKFYSGWCGGVDLVVGHHYLIATNALGDTIELASADGSILDIDGFYDPSRKKEALRSPLILPVIRAVYGVSPLPDDFPSSFIAGRTVLQPPPPPTVE